MVSALRFVQGTVISLTSKQRLKPLPFREVCPEFAKVLGMDENTRGAMSWGNVNEVMSRIMASWDEGPDDAADQPDQHGGAA